MKTLRLIRGSSTRMEEVKQWLCDHGATPDSISHFSCELNSVLYGVVDGEVRYYSDTESILDYIDYVEEKLPDIVPPQTPNITRYSVIVALSEDENTLVYNGTMYEAVESRDDCDGCDFHEKCSCKNPLKNWKCNFTRNDKREIIWKKKGDNIA